MSAPEPAAGLTRTVVRGAGIAGLGFASTLALNFGFYLVLARLATPDDFGVLAAGSLSVGLGMVFAESGMLAAVIQRRDRVEEAANTAFVSTVLGGVALTLLALALAPLIGVVFDSHRIGEVAADTGAYVSGLTFGRGGRHPMAPRISPKKTWEGFAGACVALP